MVSIREIKIDLQQYTHTKEKELLHKLLHLQIAEAEQTAFNEQLEKQMLVAFKNIMIQEATGDLCSLLNVLWQALKNPAIKKSVLITLLDSVLQCVGVADLKEVLTIIRQRIGDLGQVQSKISFNLLRIINTLLKRISKTTDFHVRGQLHLTITRIINLCHESGFEYRQDVVQTNQKIQVEDSFLKNFEESNINLEFYENFWEIQKYYMDLQQLTKPDQPDVSTPSKEDPKIVSIRLKRIQYILDDTIKYFRVNPPIENKDFTTFPLKFLKLPNLLALQLQDSYFRAVILIQTIIFCNSLKQFPAKFKMELSIEGRQTINRIEKKVNDELNAIIAIRSDANNLSQMLTSFLKNQSFWINLKDNWREKKKTFFKNNHDQVNQLKKKDSINGSVAPSHPVIAPPAPSEQEISTKKSEKVYNLSELANKCKKQILAKIEIWPKYIEGFLKHTQAPVLKKQPIVPSFSYYYSEARSCLQTFDETEQCQTYFESRGQYNLFEWKAFRSLERQRIIKHKDTDKNTIKLMDYKLLEFLKRNEEHLEGQPRKRVKTDNEQQREQ